tara:strand:+ start:249 stop:998 length:750 start_codon:yes stop_codon:yes gene_type:complete
MILSKIKLGLVIKSFVKVGFRFCFNRNKIRVGKDAIIKIHKNVSINNSNINVSSNSTLIIKEGCEINNVNLNVNGKVILGQNNVINNAGQFSKLLFRIHGELKTGDNNRIKSDIWIRFGGVLIIGDYNSINEGSEIRVDEKIIIGCFNQISYNVMIWDTNTHNVYPIKERRRQTRKNFPSIGFEFEKPATKPIFIGNDCWIAKDVAIFKGVSIADKCLIGYRTLLSNCNVSVSTIVLNEVKNKYLPNSI